MKAHNPRTNQILAAIKAQEFLRLENDLEFVEFGQGQTIYEAGDRIEHLYFPVTLAASMLVADSDGSSTCVAIVGNEGVLGIGVACGAAITPYSVVAINGGGAYRLRRQLVEREFALHSTLLDHVLRHGEALAFSFAQTAICAQRYTVEQRLCRWLLDAAEKSGLSVLPMTHAGLSAQLGVRREAVTEAARQLQDAGLIQYSRGQLAVQKPDELQRRACACHEKIAAYQQAAMSHSAEIAQRQNGHLEPPSIRKLIEERAKRTADELPDSLAEIRKMVAQLEVTKELGQLQLAELAESFAEAERLREMYAELYDFSPVAYATVDSAGIIQQVNLACAILLGHKRSEIVRHRFVDSVVPDQQAQFTRFLRDVLGGHQHCRIEVELSANHQRHMAAVLIDGVADENGRECRLVVTDITQRKALERRLAESNAEAQLLKHALDHVNAYVYLKDRDLKYRYANRMVLDLMGVTEEQLLGHDDSSHFPADVVAHFQEADRRALKGERVVDETVVRHADGRLIHTRDTKSPIYENSDGGQLWGLCAVSTDISDLKQAETKLQESYRLLELAQRTANAGAWERDFTTGRVTWSDNLYRILGLDPAQDKADGETWRRLVLPEDQERTEATINAAVADPHKPISVSTRVRLADGSIRTIDVVGDAQYDETQKPLRASGIAIDITERAELERKLRLWSVAFEESELSIAISDVATNTLVSVNRAFAKAHGRTESELIGQPVSTVFPAADWGWVSRQLAGDGGISHMVLDAPHIRADGSLFPALADITIIRGADGKATNRVVFVMDVTQLKEQEAQLKVYRDNLEELVLERTEKLQRAKLAAQAADVAKTTFLANMSHEIRTPLNGILGMAYLIGQEGLPPKQTEHLARLTESGERLAETLTAILSAAQLEAEKLRLKADPVEVTAIAEGVARTFRHKAHAKGLDMIVNIQALPGNLLGDAAALEHAMSQYLSNAIKFTNQGEIQFNVSVAGEDAKSVQVRCEVADTGVGFDQQQVPRLFERFEQGDSSLTRRYGGLGLGLAITRGLVELMGGQTGVESVRGVGSKFWFTVPLSKQKR